MKRTDTFETGDSVVWGDDPWTEKDKEKKEKEALLERTKNRLGSGPFIVKAVIPLDRAQAKAALHPQWLTLQGFPDDKISGAFFQRAG